MTQHEDIEAVKRAADGQSRPHSLAGQKPSNTPISSAGVPVQTGVLAGQSVLPGLVNSTNGKVGESEGNYDAVNPPHYQRGPKVVVSHSCSGSMVGETEYVVQAIDVFRHIKDPRLATAFKYIWRVAFGGKSEPWDSRTPEEVDARDISSAKWYLEDFLSHPPEPVANSAQKAYDAVRRDLERLQAELDSRPVKVVREYVEPKNSGIDID